MSPTEKFDLIIKLEKEKVPKELNENLEEIEKKLKTHTHLYYIKETEYFNTFMVELNQDKLKTAMELANKFLNDKLEMVPIESVMITRPEEIVNQIINISKDKIKDGETFAVKCDIRDQRYIKSPEEFIHSVYDEIEKLDIKPDEDKPDWIIHIEVLGENTGISVLKRCY